MKDLQPIPFSCTKEKLVEMYLDQISEKDIRKAVNEIIEDFAKTRKISSNKWSRRIPHIVLAEFMDTYGLPNGYFDPSEKHN